MHLKPMQETEGSGAQLFACILFLKNRILFLEIFAASVDTVDT